MIISLLKWWLFWLITFERGTYESFYPPDNLQLGKNAPSTLSWNQTPTHASAQTLNSTVELQLHLTSANGFQVQTKKRARWVWYFKNKHQKNMFWHILLSYLVANSLKAWHPLSNYQNSSQPKVTFMLQYKALPVQYSMSPWIEHGKM